MPRVQPVALPSREDGHSSHCEDGEPRFWTRYPYAVGNRFYRTLYGACMASDRQGRPVWCRGKRIRESRAWGLYR